MITLFYCRDKCCVTSEIIDTVNKGGRVADLKGKTGPQRSLTGINKNSKQ